ncbi:MAG: hypothetical protein K0B09_07475 [Bacteroidales bacterium]|nr:hypothetical protein [Bacteroidales bacterium]
MQQERFLELLNHPEKLDKGSMEQLRQLAARYPYSQPLRILLAKNLQTLKDPDFERQVNQAAAYAFDRRHFQSYMSGRQRNTVAAPPPKAETQKKKSSFALLPSWMIQLFSKKQPSQNAVQEAREVPEPPVQETGTADPVIADQQPPVSQMPRPTRKHDQLIEKFLKEEPRIKPIRDHSNQENLAERNLLEPEEIGTETLAKIFLKQGLHEKALDIYKKLSLKYPEKSSYFAEKINTVKNEINLKK